MTQFAIIFDLDGTLIDSESIAHIAWERALHHFGKQFTTEHEPLMLGVQLAIAIENVKRHFALSEPIDEIFKVLEIEWRKLTQHGLPTMPGVNILLDTLDQRGIPWGVATNSEHAYAAHHLSNVQLDTRAQAIVGCDDVANPKPAPDVFVQCAKLIGVDPEHCIAVEDSQVGYQAAAASGMMVVVVGEEASSAEFPLAHHIFPSLHQFLDELDNILPN